MQTISKLEKKNILITGGSMGLGLEIAKAFVSHKCNVMICSRNKTDLDNALITLDETRECREQIIHGEICDISSPKHVDELFNNTKEHFGSLDVLVNNAGIQGPIGIIDNIEWDLWCKTINVDLIGTAYCMRKAISFFRCQGKGGRIINLSGGGATGSRPNYSAYAAAKTGVVRLTECLADEVCNYGIYIFAVAPGALNTRMLDETLRAGIEAVGEDEYNKALKRFEEGGTPMKKATDLVCFLATEDSNMFNGRLISAVWDDWINESREVIDEHRYKLRRIV